MSDEALRVEVEIVNDLGLHTRAATTLVKLANTFQSEIEISINDVAANAKSIMGLLALGARKGKKILIVAKGKDKDRALTALTELVKNGFNEDAR